MRLPRVRECFESGGKMKKAPLRRLSVTLYRLSIARVWVLTKRFVGGARDFFVHVMPACSEHICFEGSTSSRRMRTAKIDMDERECAQKTLGMFGGGIEERFHRADPARWR